MFQRRPAIQSRGPELRYPDDGKSDDSLAVRLKRVGVVVVLVDKRLGQPGISVKF